MPGLECSWNKGAPELGLIFNVTIIFNTHTHAKVFCFVLLYFSICWTDGSFLSCSCLSLSYKCFLFSCGFVFTLSFLTNANILSHILAVHLSFFAICCIAVVLIYLKKCWMGIGRQTTDTDTHRHSYSFHAGDNSYLYIYVETINILC